MAYVNDASFQTAVTASRNASDASEVYNKSKKATAQVPDPDQAPTDGKAIPIVVGAVKLTGSVIWIHTYRNDKNECLCHVAVCFGRNMFGRTLGLVSLQQGGNYIYRRSKGKTVDPPKAVRFYDGTQTEADPKIVHHEGASKTPAFKGYIYAVLEGVKLGDITAEFTDTTQDTTITYNQACDPDLSGIELVYNPYNGRYYGLTEPMSGHSSIIISDGCKILHKVKVYSIFNKEYLDEGPNTKNFYCDKIYPLACSDMVVITGTAAVGERATWEHYVFDGAISYSPVFNPYTGKPIGGQKRSGVPQITPQFPRNGLQTYPSDSGGWGIDWKVSYRIPGSLGRICYLRNYDKSSPWCLSDFYLGALYWPYDGDVTPTLADGNVACQIVGLRNGEMDYWYQDVGRVRTDLDSNGPRPRIDDWNVRGFPEVDDFMYLKSGVADVTLAGYKKSPGSFTVHVIKHSESGISVPAVIDVAMPTTDWTADEFNYDASTDLILVSAHSNAPTPPSPRIYKVTLGGSYTFVTMGDGYNAMIPSARGIAGNGYAPVTDGTRVGKLDLTDGSVTTLGNGNLNSVVDLNKQVFSLPTIDGITKGTTGSLDVADIPLQSLIADCCAIKGYDPLDLEFQNLEDEVLLGLLISSTIRLSDLLNRLGSVFGFTFVETDRKLKFLKKRDGDTISIDTELTSDDLIRPEADSSPLRRIDRASSNNLLGGMDFEYVNPDKQFENDTIKIRRPAGTFDIGSSTRIETISVPITLDPDVAYALMYEAFYGLLKKETRIAASIMPWHARVEPGDCVKITVDGVETTGIVVRVTMREDFGQDIEMESVLDGGTTQFTSSAGTDDPDTTTPDKLEGEYIHLDIPYLSAVDAAGPSRIMQYGALTAPTDIGWSGADLYRSNDGNSFTKVAEYDFAPATVGAAVNALEQPAEPFVTDKESILVLTVEFGDPAVFVSQTYLEQINATVIAAYGRPGAWELISWREVTVDSDGMISLHNLQRGLFGTHLVYETEEKFGEGNVHEPGDKICVIDQVRLVKMQRNFSERGAYERYGVVTNTVGLDTAPKAWYTLSGRGNKLPPIHNLRATHSRGSSELKISWNQQSQVAGGWPDTGAPNPTLEPIHYVIWIVSSVADYEKWISTTDTNYVWTDYGADLGADTVPEGIDLQVKIFSFSDSYPYTGDADQIGTVQDPVMVVAAREV